ncbi:MAG: hypothetical protein ACRCZF_20355, partial [Gemmataceae bacterium]
KEAEQAEAQFRDSDAKIQRVSILNQQLLDKPFDPGLRRELAAACRAIDREELARGWERSAQALEQSPRKP